MGCNKYYNKCDLSTLTRDCINQSQTRLNETRSGRVLSTQLG